MPKRKRNEKTGYGYPALKHDADYQFGKEFANGKRRLLNALKTAKRFERQKLKQRIRRTKRDGRTEEIPRLEQELEALKTLDLSAVAEAHLYKAILKAKDIAAYPGVQDYLSREADALEPSLSDVRTTEGKNVIARLYNYKHTKSELPHIFDSIRNTLGIKVLNDVSMGSDGEGVPPTQTEKNIAKGDHLREQGAAESNNSEWEGLSSSQDQGLGDSQDEMINSHSDNDENQKSVWDEIAGVKDSHNPAYEMPLSPFGFDPFSPPPSLPKLRSGNKRQKTSNSTFLPSLMMSGYWSGGSESGQEDDENYDLHPQKKNRRGQRARREIWEKKYGRNANHLRNQGREERDHGNGANGRRKSGTHNKREGGSRAPLYQRERQKEHHDADPTSSRDKAGSSADRAKDLPLHPSWEAARKAKEQKQSVAFQGKKVVFD